jgi:hypothetical protein
VLAQLNGVMPLLAASNSGDPARSPFGLVEKWGRALTAAAQNPPPPPPAHWPVQGDLLEWCRVAGPGVAVILILAGIVYLLFGYSIFKVLVTLNAAVLGGYAGTLLGEKNGVEVPAAIVGGLLAATAAWPTMKYSVAIMGGLFGAVLGVTIWRLSNLDPSFGWSGGMTGMVLCGLMSLLLFRECIMTYTSLQGAVMLVLGILALCFKYDSVGGSLETHLKLKPFLLPMTIFVPTLIGFIYQQTMFPPAAPQQGPPKK